ncbi:MAG TPA: hypothetical protein GX504_09715 [Clostridia bacterium]|nr:hypothetical protein [Clostridia bacterium]
MMFWWSIRVLSVILGFCTAVYLVYGRLDRKVSPISVLLALALGVFFSFITELIMIAAVWPPVTVISWVLVAALMTVVAFVFLTGSRKKEAK